MSRQLVIRADADARMGTGHVMRCLALAQAWRRIIAGEVIFVGRVGADALCQRIRDEGFLMHSLEPDLSSDEEISEMRSHCASPVEGTTEWLVLDGYHFSVDYQQKLKEAGYHLLVIDDTAHLAGYQADCVLNQNIYANQLSYSCDSAVRLLLGCRYTLLRDEFAGLSGDVKKVPESARKLLITMGGADPENATLRVLHALALTGLGDLRVKAVVGVANPYRRELDACAATLPFHCELVDATSDMAGLMRWADAAVTAAGSTIYELAALGVPFMTVVVADNQEANADAFVAAGAAVFLGRASSLASDTLAVGVRGFLDDQTLRRQQVAAAGCLVDGRGAARVVGALLAMDLRLRPVRWDDRMLLLAWANNPTTRSVSFNSNPISVEEHECWFADKLADVQCRIFLLSSGVEIPFGVVRFDFDGERAVVSVNLAAEFRGLGLGSRGIRAACKMLQDERPWCIEAVVKETNPASLHAFVEAGFVESGRTVRQGEPMVFLHRYPGNHYAHNCHQ